MLFVREFRPLSRHSFSSHLFHLAQRKDYMMVVTWPWAFCCGFWVVFVVLVIFSTIRLFFPPFNDDLGTMPTRRPYSWKKIIKAIKFLEIDFDLVFLLLRETLTAG